jgi:hypothetical protein
VPKALKAPMNADPAPIAADDCLSFVVMVTALDFIRDLSAAIGVGSAFIGACISNSPGSTHV